VPDLLAIARAGVRVSAPHGAPGASGTAKRPVATTVGRERDTLFVAATLTPARGIPLESQH